MPSPHEVYLRWTANQRAIIGQEDRKLVPSGESMELTFVIGEGNDRQVMVLIRRFDPDGEEVEGPIGPLVFDNLFRRGSREHGRTENIAYWCGIPGQQVRRVIGRAFAQSRWDAARLRLATRH